MFFFLHQRVSAMELKEQLKKYTFLVCCYPRYLQVNLEPAEQGNVIYYYQKTKHPCIDWLEPAIAVAL